MSALPVAIVVVAIVVPLAREYREFRRDWGLGRLGALLTSCMLFPALGVGVALALPLAATPALQWSVTVLVTLGVYSLGTSALRPDAERAPQQSR
jgi:hypothetical protein